MADAIAFRIENLRELKRTLKRLPEKLRSRVLRGALRAGAEIFKNAIIIRLPVLTGATASNVTISIRRLRRDRSVLVALIGTGREQFYAKFGEFGTKTQPARPAVRPAFEGNVNRVQAKISEKVRTGVKREAKRLR